MVNLADPDPKRGGFLSEGFDRFVLNSGDLGGLLDELLIHIINIPFGLQSP